MRRTSLLVVAVLAVGLLAAGAAGAVAQEETTDEDDIAPGEQLSGVVGVQDAEFEGELNDNAFAIALDRADDDATRAAEIANRVNDTEARLAELEERRDRLNAQRESGEISEGEYRARTARLATESDNAQRQLNRSEEASAGIPQATLEENGVNVEAIRTLRQNASDLSGPEVSEIARSIAGENRGPFAGAGGDRTENVTAGPGDRSGDGSDAGADQRPGETDGEDAEAGSDGADRDETDQTETDTSDRDDADAEDATDDTETDGGSDSSDSAGGNQGGNDAGR